MESVKLKGMSYYTRARRHKQLCKSSRASQKEYKFKVIDSRDISIVMRKKKDRVDVNLCLFAVGKMLGCCWEMIELLNEGFLIFLQC